MSLENPNVTKITPANVFTRPGDRLAIAAQQILRAGMVNLWANNAALATASIRIMPDDRPSPDCGAVFIGIRPTETILESDGNYESVEAGVIVAITMRMGDVPWDKSGIIAAVRSRYSSQTQRQVIAWIAQGVVQTMQVNAQLLLSLANGTDYPNQPQIVHPLTLAVPNGIGNIQEVTASHFLSSQKNSGTRESVGLLQRLSFNRGFWVHNFSGCK